MTKYLFNKDLSLNASEFMISNNHYKITGTSVGKSGVGFAIDTVLNKNTGKIKIMARQSLVNMIEKYKATKIKSELLKK